MVQSRPSGLAINALEEELEEVVAFCRDEEVGVEVTAFAYPAHLDAGYGERIERHVEVLGDLEPVLCHGPFFDLYPTSPDPRIVSVARERHEAALEAAAALGAGIYVAHVNSIPLIRNRKYRDAFVSASAEFWRRMADRAGKSETTIALENMWEPVPDLQARIVGEAGHPHLKASFDNGHALVFSELPAAEWVRTLGDDLVHLHLHDNDGDYDGHRPIGEGVEDWPALLEARREAAPGAILVMESDRLEANRTSLATLRDLEERI